jgi:hypothetical protein
MSDTELEAVFRNTAYGVDHPDGDFVIRLGEPCVRLDALLREHGVTTWAYVTAWNPRSQILTDTQNAARHARLLARVRELGVPHFAGRGSADDARWSEQSLLILGISGDAALQLGALFDQHAVVVGELGGCAELRWCA